MNGNNIKNAFNIFHSLHIYFYSVPCLPLFAFVFLFLVAAFAAAFEGWASLWPLPRVFFYIFYIFFYLREKEVF